MSFPSGPDESTSPEEEIFVHEEVDLLSADGGTPATPPAAGSPAQEATAPKLWGWPRRLRGALPTVLVMGALASVAAYGHQNGWKVQARSSAQAAEKAEDWCEEHGVPQSRCLACNPSLAGGDPNDWCKEHGIAESKCTVCHPEILTEGQAADWCREHGVPESQCTVCHPEVAVKTDLPPGDDPVEVSWAPTQTEGEPVNARNCQIHAAYVQFASPEAVRKAGVALEQVHTRPMRAHVEALAEVAYDQTRVARVASRVPGIVAWVGVEVGDRVQEGDVLALVDSVQVGAAKAEVLEALADLELRNQTQARVEESAASGLGTAAEVQEAAAALRKARVRLFNAEQALRNIGLPCDAEALRMLPEAEMLARVRSLGVPGPLRDELGEHLQAASLVPLKAPLGGVVVSRDVVAGEVLSGARSVFVVADTSRMWIEGDVLLSDAGLLAVGQPLTFRANARSAGGVARGELSWIATSVDDRTRTLRVRAVVPNPDGSLRANTFGQVQITVRDAPEAIAVPSEALHWEGCCYITFVRVAEAIFQPRKVVPGVTQRGFTEIRVGLLPGEAVAAAGSHVLKSQALKSRLGAGCADE